MRKFINLLVVLFFVSGLISCTKDSDVFIPDPGQIIGPDSTWYADITPGMPVNNLRNILKFAPDIDSVEMDNLSHTIIFPSGLECTFQERSFVTQTGSPVEGKVGLEAYLLKKKGDLIRMSRPTVSDDRMLISGGTFFIQGKKDGAVLKLGNDKKLYVRYNSNYISSLMKLFNEEDGVQQFDWIQCADTTNNLNKVTSTATGYEISTNRLNWMNCNYYYDIHTSDSVKITLKLPPYFTNANTLAYVVFNDHNSVISMPGNANIEKFVSSAVPAGKSVTVVTITKEGNFLYLGHNGFVTNNSSTAYQNVNINPVHVSLDDIKNYLNSL
ncbi:MAG: hypothetical protein V4556_03925 [Bacteroidota bacterium]